MVRRTVLDNGLRILTEQVPHSHSVSLGIWVCRGSRHETEELSGISHFVEHMLFKGTERRTAREIARAIDSAGGVLNGFTSREYCCYYAKVLDEQLPLAVDLLGDALCRSNFDPDEIEKERRVILQEIAMLEDSPEEHIHDLFARTFWGGHPLGRPVTGSRETVDAIDRARLLGFLHEHYTLDRIMVVAAGNLAHDQLVELAAASLASLPATAGPVPTSPPDIRRNVRITEQPLEQSHVCLGLAFPPQNDPERYTAYLLNTILGGNMSSRLFQSVRERQGLAYSVYSYLNHHSDSGAIVLSAGTAVVDAPRVVASMLEELRRLRQETVTDEELQAAKQYLRGSLLLSMENTDNRMTRLAQNELFLNRPMTLAESLERLDEVTPADLQALARHYFTDGTLNLQAIGRIRLDDFPLTELHVE